MEVVRKIVNAEMLLPFIDLPWASKGSEVEVFVFPINNTPACADKRTTDIDMSFGGWADMDKTTEEICTEIRASRTFRDRTFNIAIQ